MAIDNAQRIHLIALMSLVLSVVLLIALVRVAADCSRTDPLSQGLIMMRGRRAI
jgi:hypothetical protein